MKNLGLILLLPFSFKTKELRCARLAKKDETKECLEPNSHRINFQSNSLGYNGDGKGVVTWLLFA